MLRAAPIARAVAPRRDPPPEHEAIQVAIDARLQPDIGPLVQDLAAPIHQGARGGHNHRGDQAVEIDQLNH
eukprot:7637916-Alexandrium_andersonii.AAC.1